MLEALTMKPTNMELSMVFLMDPYNLMENEPKLYIKLRVVMGRELMENRHPLVCFIFNDGIIHNCFKLHIKMPSESNF